MRREILIRRGQRKPPPLPTETVEIPRYPNEPSPPEAVSWWLVVAPAFGMMAMAIGIGFITGNFLYAMVILSVAFIYPSIILLQTDKATPNKDTIFIRLIQVLRSQSTKRIREPSP